MDRRSLLIGAATGGWIITLLFALPVSPLHLARADPPPGLGNPNPAPPDPVTPTTPGRSINPSDGSAHDRVVPASGYGASSSNGHAIAITGPVPGGDSVVYFFDTDHQRLLVYQYRASGGGTVLNPNDRGGIVLLAARHIDYDLKLEEYRDRSERTRNQMKAAYDAEFIPGAPAMGDGDLPVKKVEISRPK